MTEVEIEKPFQILVPINVSPTTVREVLWGAFNQGSTYWLGDIEGDDNCSDSYIEQIIKGKSLTILVPEDDSDTSFEKHTLTLVNVLDGIKQYVEEYGDCIEKGEVDSCLLDSIDCDIILQYSLFGETVFG